jgi:hypothetical protein
MSHPGNTTQNRITVNIKFLVMAVPIIAALLSTVIITAVFSVDVPHLAKGFPEVHSFEPGEAVNR